MSKRSSGRVVLAQCSACHLEEDKQEGSCGRLHPQAYASARLCVYTAETADTDKLLSSHSKTTLKEAGCSVSLELRRVGRRQLGFELTSCHARSREGGGDTTGAKRAPQEDVSQQQ